MRLTYPISGWLKAWTGRAPEVVDTVPPPSSTPAETAAFLASLDPALRRRFELLGGARPVEASSAPVVPASPLAANTLASWEAPNPYLAERTSVPSVADADDRVLLALSMDAIRHGGPMLMLDAEQIARDVANLMKSADRDRGFSQFDAPAVAEYREALAAFAADPTSPFGAATLRQFRANMGRAIQELEHISGELSVRDSISTRGMDHHELARHIEIGIATLQAMTIKTGSLEGGRVVDALIYDLGRHKALVAAAQATKAVSLGDKSAGGNVARALITLRQHPEWREDTLKLIATQTTPKQRAALLPGLVEASGAYQRKGYVLTFAEAYRWADAIYKIDHPGQAYESTAGSHALLGKLFRYGGQNLSVQTTDDRTLEGNLFVIDDLNADEEGSVPRITLTAETEFHPENAPTTEVRLNQVARIHAGDVLVYDRERDGAIEARAFKATEPQRLLAETFSRANVVGDYSISRPRLEELLWTVALSPEVTGSREASDVAQRDLQDLRAEAALRLPTAEAIYKAFVAQTIGAKALEVLRADVGPKHQYEAALTAVGVAEGSGYKAWSMDRSSRNLLELLQRGTPAKRIAAVESSMAGTAAMLRAELSELPVVDARFEKHVRAVLGGRANAIKFGQPSRDAPARFR